jgi:arylsulfatase A-like enzyme
MGYTSPDKKVLSYRMSSRITQLTVLMNIRTKTNPSPFTFPTLLPTTLFMPGRKTSPKYRGKYKIGWDKIREQRFKRMNKMGIIGPNHKLTPRASKAWDDLSEEQKDAEDLKMAVYAAMIDRVDQNLGRLFAKVKELGEWDNTLIMFLTDNGACPEQPNTTPDIPPGPVESYRTVSVGWANASNTPYRKFKSTDYEGGIRTPFIAHWPGVIKPGMTNQGRPHHRCIRNIQRHHRSEIS